MFDCFFYRTILEYDLDCRIQSYKIQPANRPDGTFPSLKMTIGYAYRGSKEHKRLLNKISSHIVSIDFSFNEKTNKKEEIKIDDNHPLYVYSLFDLIAEKFRAILQQEQRNRE